MNQKLKKFFSDNQGISLVEIVFVILLSFLLLSGLAAAVVFMISAAQFSRNKSFATQIAKKQMELFKYQKQRSDWWNGIVCNNVFKSCAETKPNFTCQYKFSNCNLGGEKKSVEINIVVYWGATKESKGTVELNSVLTNWEQ